MGKTIDNPIPDWDEVMTADDGAVSDLRAALRGLAREKLKVAAEETLAEYDSKNRLVGQRDDS